MRTWGRSVEGGRGSTAQGLVRLLVIVEAAESGERSLLQRQICLRQANRLAFERSCSLQASVGRRVNAKALGERISKDRWADQRYTTRTATRTTS